MKSTNAQLFVVHHNTHAHYIGYISDRECSWRVSTKKDYTSSILARKVKKNK